MNQEITIGEIIGVHGIRGELKVRPLTDDPGRFYELEQIIVCHKGKKKNYDIEMVRLHKGSVLLMLVGIENRTIAEGLKGAQLLVPRQDAVDLDPDEYFISDLIGLRVEDEEGNVLGEVRDILTTTGTVDTVELKTTQGSVYVPFRKVYFKTVDFEGERIITQIPDSFFELNS